MITIMPQDNHHITYERVSTDKRYRAGKVYMINEHLKTVDLTDYTNGVVV